MTKKTALMRIAEVMSVISWVLSIGLLAFSCGPAACGESFMPVLLVAGMLACRMVHSCQRNESEDGAREIRYQLVWVAVLVVMTAVTYGARYNFFGGDEYLSYDHQEKTMSQVSVVAWRPWSRYTMVDVRDSPFDTEYSRFYTTAAEFYFHPTDNGGKLPNVRVLAYFKMSSSLKDKQADMANRLSALAEPDDSSVSFWRLVRWSVNRKCADKVLVGLDREMLLGEQLSELLMERLESCLAEDGFSVKISEFKVAEVGFQARPALQ